MTDFDSHNRENIKEIEVSANELYTLLMRQLDEWKAHLKTLLEPDDEVAERYIDGIKLATTRVYGRPSETTEANISVTYEMPDELIIFAKSEQAPKPFVMALLENGIELDEPQN